MSAKADNFHMPPEKKQAFRRAKRLEWLTIVFLLTIIAVIALTMGASQTMKAVWAEDLLSLIPPVAFLLGAHYRDKPSNNRFPYGYRRAVLIAFLASALALLSFGVYILADSVIKLLTAEHPTIQTFGFWGHRVWLGWGMIAALIYSVIPPVVLGRMKLPLARELSDKSLQADADINRADWLTGGAGVLGILGIAFGYWWADATAAGLISLEIVRDGVENLKVSIAHLMNKRPTNVEGTEKDPSPDKLEQELERLDWVAQARVRLREDGDILTGEAFIVPHDDPIALDKLEQAAELANTLDWRLHDVSIVPVRSAAGGAGAKPD